MKNSPFLYFGIAFMVIMALPVFAQEGAKRATKARAVVENAPMDSLVEKQLNSVLGYLGERVGQQADLGSDEVTQLKAALHESVEKTMSDDESILQDWTIAAQTGTASTADFLEKTLSYPDTKAVLSAHLSDDQIQQCVSDAKSRNHQKRLAQASQIVATVDPHLSFSAAQRRALADTIATDPKLGIITTRKVRSLTIEVMMRIDPNTMLQMIPQPVRQQIGESLTPTQTTAWELLLPQAKSLRKVKQNKGAIKKGDKTSASDHRRDLIVATLAAHTEQLGELDARASKRLELVSKGVVVQHMESLEAREQASEGADARLEQEMRAIREAIGAGRLTREQAAERMEGLRRQMAATMRRVPPSTLASGITNHPLYQKTIQDVLSEDAFGAYQAHRAKRESFRQQAVRNLVVANLDGQMLFDSAQQKDVQQISSVIEVVAEAPAYRVLSRVVEGLDKDNLSDWQREVFDSMLDD